MELVAFSYRIALQLKFLSITFVTHVLLLVTAVSALSSIVLHVSRLIS